MPQRFLRPGITNSDAWNSVSFGAQSFYIRILTLVDDYGRYDGRIQILHSHCFALRSDIKPQHSAAFRSELQSSGLILVYELDGKEFIQITKWQERARGPSKYPVPQESAGIRSELQRNPASLAIVPSPSHESSPSDIGTPAASVSKFKKPEIPELAMAMAKAGCPESEAQKFLNYYESNGWKVGRNPMKSWTHAVGNWASNYRANFKPPVNQNRPPSTGGF